jgi:hypothetical protein
VMRMNFEEKEMRRLEALKEIAELLNEATNLQDMFVVSFNASKRRISFSSKFILITNYNYNIKKFLNSINKI